MRPWLVSLPVLLAAVGCVGPQQHVRGGYHGGYHGGRHHHHGGVGHGLLAFLDAAVALTEIAADVSYIAAAASSHAPSTAVVGEPHAPPPEPVRPLRPWFQGILALSESSRATLPELRMGLSPAPSVAGPYLAIIDSDELGRFSFATPPAGSYTLTILDSDYAGELTFATDGKTTFPLVLPVAARAKSPVDATKP